MLLCSWLSPSTTLQPLTLVIMGILNGVMPILTDTILLIHIVIERVEHAKSRFTAIYISACAEFVLSSVTSEDGVPDMDILNAAQARSMQIACSLQMIDNSSIPTVYKMRSNNAQGLKGLARYSDVPQHLERIKVIVNVVGATSTTIAAALVRWRAVRLAAAEIMRRDVEVNETTALVTSLGMSYVLTFNAELIDVNMKEEEAQMAFMIPLI
ncbi:hypothetical protein B0F90DRAFT_1760806 [Multifurca ochricompacta]|uniref:Uncharacterized protein n=1 Tax=Multifurca ochricompacta TaxID=376703 RepID=A0AAD4QKA4_9AGAM|nr:hypothetical protein B0F90DRAFT_1760806 [Multifurca ochricompacta]